MKKGKGRDVDRWYSNNSFKHLELSKYVAFLHAVSGCDTVSSLYKQGKNKLVKVFNSNHAYLQLLDVFYQKNAPRDEIAKNMYKIISLLYSNKINVKLNEHRYEHFKRSTSRASFKLENLPPTEGAAKQHAYRVYFQLQQWLGNENDVTLWGWSITENMIIPVYSEEPLIPDEIIKKYHVAAQVVVKQTHVVVEQISLNVQVFAHIVTHHNVKISKLLPTSKKTKTLMMPSKSFLT